MRQYLSSQRAGAAAFFLALAAMPVESFASGTLIAAYDGDESGGATVGDRSGNGNTGYLVNNVARTAGRYNGGLSFDGAGAFVAMGDIAQANGRSRITVSLWVKFDVNGGGASEVHLIDKSSCNGYVDGGPWELGVGLSQSHKAEFVMYPRNGSPAPYLLSGASTTSVDDGAWHFIAGRYDGARVSIWVDGVQENATEVGAAVMSSSGNQVELGGHCNGYSYSFQGTLDEIRIYDGALTQVEMQSDMATPLGSTLVDTTSPTVALTAPVDLATVTGSMSIRANATDNVAVAFVQFYLDGAPLGARDTTAPYVLQWDSTSSANGAHVLAALAQDSAGNATLSGPITALVSNSVSPPPDLTPPSTPTNLVLEQVSSTSASISWIASTDEVGVAGYVVYRDQIAIGTTTEVGFNDAALTPSTTYSYAVKAFDAAQNISAPSSPLVVSTAPLPIDTAPPSVPSRLRVASASATQIVIAWDPSNDNVAVAGYRVFRNGSELATIGATNFADSGLAPNSLYSYTVAAYDEAGNSSIESAPLQASTTVDSDVSYSTNFNLKENPIAEGGVWHRADNAWTNVRVVSGVAYGTNGANDGYDDSYALLSGFGPDQTAEAIVYRNQNLVPGSSHEVALLLRFTDDTENARGYECLVDYSGGFNIVRWNGPMGDYTSLDLVESGYFGRELVTGDVLKATIIGTEITIYINDVLIARAFDDAIVAGQPGISFFKRPDGSNRLLGLTSYKVSSPTSN